MSRLVVALLCALCCACASLTEPEEEWISDEIEVHSERVLFEVTVLSMQKAGFPLGAGLDPSRLQATSGWHISLAPFRGKGYREQCEVRYTPRAPRKYGVEVRVRRENNDDIARPLDISYAQWEKSPDNKERAAIVLQYIKSMLGSPMPVGPKPERP